MIEERYAHLERPRHARAIDLGQDVTGEVGLEVGILNLSETIVCLGSFHTTAQKVDRFVSLKLVTVRPRQEAVTPGVEGRELVVAKALRDLLGLATVIISLRIEGHRARVDGCLREPGHHGDHGTRIVATGKEGAQWHIGHHTHADYSP